MGKKIICPKDVVISDGNEIKTIDITKEGVPDGWMALDIGEESREIFSQIIKQSQTVFINGPLGKNSDEKFISGSIAIINAMKEVDGTTIIAGGDTIDLVRKYGKLENYTHVSLAGGATLEFLAGKELPALKALQ